ncbi:MAG: hypothetical protein NZ772_14120 [Cyanobacteria bacterium]|nr:hypothetical protein [Cyanobacteriota bacterium]MDW8202509.1 hypothetical protein [Cyanobacteriota bacterium SKYGB_h_bin112]
MATTSTPNHRLGFKRSRPARVRRARRANPLLGITIETSVKLTVNLLLSALAGVSLLKMVPDYLTQQKQLTEINTQVQQAEARVKQLQTDFSLYFDPAQESVSLQNSAHYIKPYQRRIIWANPR